VRRGAATPARNPSTALISRKNRVSLKKEKQNESDGYERYDICPGDEDAPDVVKVLAKYNLGCIGCMGAQAESLEQGCSAHGLNVDEVLKDLNQLFV